ncbi:ABC transporter ATP-binding protein [Virgibacillus pantothenticus]|uniref:ABC transporter ATP-binding protein n=1 Tax=Virgibacillus TaxID=84406 RepID=UPI00090A3AC5|nr:MULTISPECIES: ABC transporter ATP-binding protein [Virgibacillus]API90741.1 hypothetical protein BKP57_02010 [Virgibacillus sp. 6R]MBS7427658.1 ABC transporter ATP-binding protein [Virgibacillus sp. 19R1-5]GIP65365.1 ABC transporter ATP-binding protein [Virgibacillus pantothenticus]
MTVLKIDNLWKYATQKKPIIKNINLEVSQGEILAVIGPNGAGKTTLLKSISGLHKIDEGTIDFNGLNFKNDREEILNKLGVIIENPCFYNHLTAQKNLLVFSRMKKEKASEELINKLLLHFKLNKYKKRKFSKYSLGMKQRLALVEIMLNDPQILILDEPTNGLDPKGVVEFRIYLNHLATEKRKSIIIASHDLSEIEKICDSYIFLSEGENITTRKIKKSDTITMIELENINTFLEILVEADIDYIYNPKVKSTVFVLNATEKKIKNILSQINEENSNLMFMGNDLEALYLKINQYE